MLIIKKVIKNIIWFIFMLSIFSMFFVVAYETGSGVFKWLAILTFILMTGLYRPILKIAQDVRKHFS